MDRRVPHPQHAFLNFGEAEIKGNVAVTELHGKLRCIQEILQRFEGTLYQCLMDDKGLTAVCAFGLPPLAHEDDLLRAVEAAIALREELAGKSTSTSIGISTGTVFCGVYGNTRRRQYTTLGDTINLSARLMQAATSEVVDQSNNPLTLHPLTDGTGCLAEPYQSSLLFVQ